MRIHYVVAASLAAALFAGCTPSPEKVCGHFGDIATPEIEKMMKAFGKDMSDADKTKMKGDCTTELDKMKSEKPDDYKKTATCVMDAKEFKDLEKCDLGKSEKKIEKAEKKADKGDDKADDKADKKDEK